MRCEDGFYYVVKFQNNPQGLRILANEMLAAKLAQTLGLPVSEPEVIEVSEWLVERSPEMYIQCGNGRVRCAAGFQFGSRFPCDPFTSPVYDFLPDTQLATVLNLESFCGMLVFDQWTCNCDSRQAVFHRANGSGMYIATMVDQGFCFNANEWNFPDSPLRGLYSRQAVYGGVVDLRSFEPFLSRLEHLPPDFLEEAASCIPPEWYEGRTDELGNLLSALEDRRSRAAQFIQECRRASPNSFPNWSKHE